MVSWPVRVRGVDRWDEPGMPIGAEVDLPAVVVNGTVMAAA